MCAWGVLEQPWWTSDDEFAYLLRAAATAPDHGKLRPWRWVLVRGEGRVALGRCFADECAGPESRREPAHRGAWAAGRDPAASVRPRHRHRRFAEQARADGDVEAAKLFSEITADEGRHRDAFRTALKVVTTGRGTIPTPPKADVVSVPAGLPKVKAARTKANLDTALHGEALAVQREAVVVEWIVAPGGVGRRRTAGPQLS
ncbi:nitroreductase family protein [Streptomyces sp. NPDC086766]|uniref:nitroreductase family protein n=1 Tax=Streptomyces sp. NPDC086766 TaxID=3365754 RepID=UPI00381F35E8